MATLAPRDGWRVASYFFGRGCMSTCLVACVSFLVLFVYVSRISVNLFTFSFYSLRSPRRCARLHGCKGAGPRCCQQPFGAPTDACELSYSASSRLRFFLEWVHFCIEFDFVDPVWHCVCGSAWNGLQRVTLRNISLSIFLAGLNFRL